MWHIDAVLTDWHISAVLCYICCTDWLTDIYRCCTEQHCLRNGSEVCMWHIHRVGQNHIYTVCIRYFWQGNHHIYGHIRCIYTVLASPTHTTFGGFSVFLACLLNVWSKTGPVVIWSFAVPVVIQSFGSARDNHHWRCLLSFNHLTCLWSFNQLAVPVIIIIDGVCGHSIIWRACGHSIIWQCPW